MMLFVLAHISLPTPEMRLRSSRCCNPRQTFGLTVCSYHSAGHVGVATLVGTRPLGFAFGCCVPKFWEILFAKVSFRKVFPAAFVVAALATAFLCCRVSQPRCLEAPGYHACGVKQQGRVLGSLFLTQNLKGCGSTC